MERPPAVAVTEYEPKVAFAVKLGAVATPEAFVVTVAVLVPVLAKVPLAPEEGAVKVTDTFGTGLLLPSRTVACSKVVNALPARVF